MSLSKPSAPFGGADVEGRLQSALETMHKLGSYYKVDTTSFTFHPEQPECDKIFSAYYKKQKYATTYSNVKTLATLGGRMLYAAVAKHAGLTPNVNASGCVLWYHGWGENTKCYHGEGMCKKRNEIEMPTTSEAGAAALKEGRGTVETNRWGKHVVKIVQEKFVTCMEDLHQKGGQHSASSCGLAFTDFDKARTAMANAEDLTKIVFPNAHMKGCLFMPVHCECNPGGKVIMGRQVCKAVPFVVSGTDGLKEADLSPMQACSVRHPALFVFQCCNASGVKGKGGCDFKASHADLLQVLVMVRKMWTEVMGAPMAVTFPRFKWHKSLRVQSALLPEGSVDEELNPFGVEEEEEETEVPETPPKKRPKLSAVAAAAPKKKKKRIVIEESSDEEDDDDDQED